MPVFRVTLTQAQAGQTLRHVALCDLGLSGSQFKRAKFHGTVLLDGAPALADARLQAGQVLELQIPEREAAAPAPFPLALSVPYEDQHFLMIDKPAPLPSASSPKQAAPTLENAVYAYLGCPEPFVYRPVNRLDKGTSGLMLVAKTAHCQHLLQQLLHTQRFLREYLAITQGCPPQDEGVIDLPIQKAEGATVRREVHPGGKAARTQYRVLRRGNGRALVWLRLDTGRTHQIRVHLSALGCPVAGDFLYGTELPELPGRFALHSALCRVWHPVAEAWIQRESPLPPALEHLLEKS